MKYSVLVCSKHCVSLSYFVLFLQIKWGNHIIQCYFFLHQLIIMFIQQDINHFITLHILFLLFHYKYEALSLNPTADTLRSAVNKTKTE